MIPTQTVLGKNDLLALLSRIQMEVTDPNPEIFDAIRQSFDRLPVYKINMDTLHRVSHRTAMTLDQIVKMANRPIYVIDTDTEKTSGWGIVTLSKYTVLINGQPLTDSQYLFYDEPTQEEILDAITNGDTSS